jgi:hypothetical protein
MVRLSWQYGGRKHKFRAHIIRLPDILLRILQHTVKMICNMLLCVSNMLICACNSMLWPSRTVCCVHLWQHVLMFNSMAGHFTTCAFYPVKKTDNMCGHSSLPLMAARTCPGVGRVLLHQEPTSCWVEPGRVHHDPLQIWDTLEGYPSLMFEIKNAHNNTYHCTWGPSLRELVTSPWETDGTHIALQIPLLPLRARAHISCFQLYF